MPNYNSTLQLNNDGLQSILNTINELPEAEGEAGTFEAATVTLRNTFFESLDIELHYINSEFEYVSETIIVESNDSVTRSVLKGTLIYAYSTMALNLSGYGFIEVKSSYDYDECPFSVFLISKDGHINLDR